MKLKFEGTLEEFRSLFRTADASDLPQIQQQQPASPVPASSPTAAAVTTVTAAVVPANRWWHAAASTKEAPRGTPPEVLTMTVSDPQREIAWNAFCDFVKLWIENFGIAGAEQPPRQQAMQELGSSPHVVAILVMAYELRSLQRLVQRALITLGDERSTDLDFCNTIASHMVTLSNMGFPDAAGTYDFGTGWRRP